MNSQNIKKLLNISSLPIDDITFNVVDNGSNDIQYLLSLKNGFYAFESALHVFSGQELSILNSVIKTEKLYDVKNRLYFAEDIFGNLFYSDNKKIYLLDVETEEMEFIASSLDGWSKKILDNYNYLTGYSLAHEWQQQQGLLDNTKRLVPKKLFVFGGAYSIENLVEQNRFEALKYRSNISKQLKNVKDGEKIVIDTKPNDN
jgi:hypothetical protein